MARFHEDEQRLTIRIRHYGIRFLCLVLFIVSVVCFNNPKKPDGPILGGFFLSWVVVLLLMSRSVTIEIDRGSGRFTLRYGGILFGIPKKTIERPLAELTYATTEAISNSGLGRTTSGGGSRAVFVFTSGKVPLTKFMSGGDMAVHHEIENRVNAFLQKPK